MSFSNDLASFEAKTQENMIKVIRYSAFDLFSSIVFQTPVDKGVLRNNWYAEVNTPSAETTSKAAPVGTATVGRINDVLKKVDLEDIIYLTNNLPYSVPIEYDGHSAKAPDGMVRVNTARWQSIVEANVRKYNK